jgi:hypothetical protein
LGQNAGFQATNASYSTLIGYNVGNANVLSSIGSNNIIIGTNISLSAGTTNSINLGGVLFAITHIQQLVEIQVLHKQMVELVLVNPTANLHIAASTTLSAYETWCWCSTNNTK